MWLLYAVLSAVFAGVTAILAKVGIRNVESNLATALRTVVVLVFAWIMVWIQGSYHTIREISGHTLLFLVLSGLATGASWLFYFKALQTGDVNKVAPIDKSSTVLTIILAFVILGEDITVLKFICILLIGLGTGLMVFPGRRAALKKLIKESDSEKDNKNDIQNDGNYDNAVKIKRLSGSWFVYACLAAVFASLTAILGKIGISGVESNLGTAIRTVVVLVMAWTVVFVSGKQKEIRKIGGGSVLFLVLSGMTTGLSWMCYYKALQDGLTSVVVSVDKLSILLTVLFSAVFLKEKISGRMAAGLGCITAGTLLLLVK